MIAMVTDHLQLHPVDKTGEVLQYSLPLILQRGWVIADVSFIANRSSVFFSHPRSWCYPPIKNPPDSHIVSRGGQCPTEESEGYVYCVARAKLLLGGRRIITDMATVCKVLANYFL